MVQTKYFDKIAGDYQKRSHSGCWGWLRHREAKGIFDGLELAPDWRVLDIGCGAGYYADWLSGRGISDYFGVDASPEMIRQLRKRGYTGATADAHRFRSGREFQLVLALGMLEFCEDPEAVLDNLGSQLAPGGILQLFVPRGGLWGTGYRLFHSFRRNRIKIPSADAYIRSGANSGLELVRVQSIWPSGTAVRMKRPP